MACSITVTGVWAVSSAGTGAASVIATGTASECGQVNVTLICGENQFHSSGTVVAGLWTATFEGTDNCPCGTQIEIYAQCATDPSCPVGRLLVSNLDCCPSISVAAALGSCEAAGGGTFARRVIFSYGATAGPTPSSYYWDWGDGTPPTVVTGGPWPPSTSPPPSHAYGTRPTRTPQFCVTGPGACLTTCFAAPIPTWADCSCPSIGNIKTSIGDCYINPYTGEEDRLVTFNISYTGTLATAWAFDYGDGSAPAGGPGSPPSSITHPYHDKPKTTPTLSVFGSLTCGTATFAVPLTAFDAFVPCECPQISDLQLIQHDDCTVDATAVTVGSPSSFFWQWPAVGGTGASTTTTTAPNATSPPVNVGAGGLDYTVVVTGSGPDGCKTAPCSRTIHLNPCSPPVSSPNIWSFVCSLFPLALGAATGIAACLVLLSAIFTYCVPVPAAASAVLQLAAVFGIIAGVILGAWLLMCALGKCCPNQCDWLEVGFIATLAPLVVGLAMLACCTSAWLVLTLIGLFAATTADLARWIARCKPGACLVSAAVMTAVLIDAVAYVFPKLTAFISDFAIACTPSSGVVTAAQIVGTLAAFIVAGCAIVSPRSLLPPSSNQ